MPEWIVIYKAIADFSDLTKKAADALAQLEAMKKAIEATTASEVTEYQRVTSLRNADVKSIKDSASAMDMMNSKAQMYNRFVNWQGNTSSDQFLAYLQRQIQYTHLLNIERQRGFYSVYQDYAFRNQELAQMIAYQRASQAGYVTPDQYIQYLQLLTTTMREQNSILRDRAVALNEVTQAYQTSGVRSSAVGGGGSDEQFLAAAQASQKAVKELSGQTVKAFATLDDSKLLAIAAADTTVLHTLGDMIARPQVELDPVPVLTAAAEIRRAMAELQTEQTRMAVSYGAVPRGWDASKPLTGGVEAGPSPPLTLNDTQFRLALAEDTALLKVFSDTTVTARAELDDTAFLASVAAMKAAAESAEPVVERLAIEAAPERLAIEAAPATVDPAKLSEDVSLWDRLTSAIAHTDAELIAVRQDSDKLSSLGTAPLRSFDDDLARTEAEFKAFGGMVADPKAELNSTEMLGEFEADRKTISEPIHVTVIPDLEPLAEGPKQPFGFVTAAQMAAYQAEVKALADAEVAAAAREVAAEKTVTAAVKDTADATVAAGAEEVAAQKAVTDAEKETAVAALETAAAQRSTLAEVVPQRAAALAAADAAERVAIAAAAQAKAVEDANKAQADASVTAAELATRWRADAAAANDGAVALQLLRAAVAADDVASRSDAAQNDATARSMLTAAAGAKDVKDAYTYMSAAKLQAAAVDKQAVAAAKEEAAAVVAAAAEEKAAQEAVASQAAADAEKQATAQKIITDALLATVVASHAAAAKEQADQQATAAATAKAAAEEAAAQRAADDAILADASKQATARQQEAAATAKAAAEEEAANKAAADTFDYEGARAANAAKQIGDADALQEAGAQRLVNSLLAAGVSADDAASRLTKLAQATNDITNRQLIMKAAMLASAAAAQEEADKVAAAGDQEETAENTASEAVRAKGAAYDYAAAREANEAKFALAAGAAAKTAGDDATDMGDKTTLAASVGTAHMGLLTRSMVDTSQSILGLGGWFGWLGNRVSLFAGIGNRTVSVLHIILDAALELGIQLGLAAIGVAALGAAVGIFIGVADLSGDTLGKISDRLKAVYEASTATGQAISPMTDSFNKLQGVIRPEVWELYGDAINLAGTKMGLLGSIAEKTGEYLDQLAGKIVAWANQPAIQNMFAGIIKAGIGMAQRFGQIFESMGSILGKFLQVAEQTHIAEYLLDIGVAIAKIAADVVKLIPGPVLVFALALHAVYLWGGLAATAIASLLDPLRAAALAMGGLDVASSKLANVGEDATGFQKLKATLQDIGAGFGNLGKAMLGSAATAKAAAAEAEAAWVEADAAAEKSANAVTAAQARQTTAVLDANDKQMAAEKAQEAAQEAQTAATNSASTDQIAAMERTSAAAKEAADQQIAASNEVRAAQLEVTAAANASAADQEAAIARLDAAWEQEAAAARAAAEAQEAADEAATAAANTASTEQIAAMERTSAAAKEAADAQIAANDEVKASQVEVAAATTASTADQEASDAARVTAADATTAATEASNTASATSFGKIGAAISSLVPFVAANPIVVIGAAAVIALAAVTAKVIMTRDATQNWINTMNTALAKQSVFTVISKTVGDLAATTLNLSKAQGSNSVAAGELATQQSNLNSKLVAEVTHVDQISKLYGTNFVGALSLLNTAGVSTNALFSKQAGVWAGALVQVAGLVKGYQEMGQGLSQLQGDVSVQLVMNADQLAAMQKLNTAWDNWLTTVTGGETALDNFGSQLATVTTNAKAAGASMDGFNAQSLTLNSSFQSLVTNAGQVQDQIRTQSAVLENGTKGTADLNNATKDLAAQMIPLAGNSKTAQAGILAMVQEANPSINTWQKLTQWIGPLGAAGATKDLSGIMGRLEVPLSNLQQDAQKLGESLQSDLNPAMAQAVFNAHGGQAVFSNFADAVTKFGATSPEAAQHLQPLLNEIVAVDGHTAAGKAAFEAFAASLGITKPQADKMWASFHQGAAASDKLRSSLASMATGGKQIASDNFWQQFHDDFFKAFSPIDAYFRGVWKVDVAAFKIGLDAIGTAVGIAGDALVGAFKIVGDLLTGNWGAAWRAMKTTFDQIWHQIDNFFNKLPWSNDVKSALKDVGNAFRTGWDDVVRFFTQSVSHFWDVLTNPGKLMSALAKIGSDVSKWISTLPFAKDIAKVWDAAWADLVAPVERAFNDVKRTITSGFDAWWKSHGQEVKDVWNVLWAAFIAPVVRTFNHVKQLATDVFTFIFGKGATLKTVWNDFEHAAVAAWNYVKDAARDAWTLIDNEIHLAEKVFQAVWVVIKSGWKVIWDVIATGAKTAWDIISGIFKTGAKIFIDLFKGAWKIIWDVFAATAKIAWDILVAIVNVVLDLITGHFSKAWQDIKTGAIQVWNAIKAVGEQIWNAIKSAGLAAFHDLWNGIKTTAGQVWNALKTGFDQVWNAIKAAGEGIYKVFKTQFDDIGKAAVTLGHAMEAAFNAVADVFTKTLPHAAQDFVNFWTKTVPHFWTIFNTDVVDKFVAFFTNTIPHAVTDFVNFFTKTVPHAFETVWNGAKAVAAVYWATLKADVSAFVAFFTNTIPHAFETVWNGAKAVAAVYWATLKADVTAFVNFFTEKIPQIWTSFQVHVVDKFVAFFTNTVPHAWQDFVNFFTQSIPVIWNDVQRDFGDKIIAFFENTIPHAFDTVVSYISGKAKEIWNDIFHNLVSPMLNFFKNIPHDVEQALKGFGSLVQSGLKSIPVIGRFLAVGGEAEHTPGTATAHAGPGTGGHVPGTVAPRGTSEDVVPAMLTPGEFVVRKDAAAALRQHLGPQFLENVNQADKILVGQSVAKLQQTPPVGTHAVPGGAGGGFVGMATGGATGGGTAFSGIGAALNVQATQGSEAFTKMWNSFAAEVAKIGTMLQGSLGVTLTGDISKDTSAFNAMWTAVASGFSRDVVGKVQPFFTSTLPGWIKTVSASFTAMWTKASNDFTTNVADKIKTFFSTTLSGETKTATSSFSTLWTTAGNGFATDVTDKVKTFFTTALTGYTKTATSAFTALWTTAGNDFATDLANKIKTFFTTTLPGETKTATTSFSTLWTTAGNDFATDLANKIKTFFTTTLPGETKTATTDFTSLWTTAGNDFATDLANKVKTFFTTTLPGETKTATSSFSTLWTTAGNDFATDLADKIKTFFTTTLPGETKTATTSFSTLWTTAGNDFATDLVNKVKTFFTTTLPGYTKTATAAFTTLWTTAGNDFATDLVNKVKTFFTTTLPGYTKTATAAFTTMWTTAGTQFASDLVTKVTTFFTTTLSGDIKTATTSFTTMWTSAASTFASDLVTKVTTFFTTTLAGLVKTASASFTTMWTSAASTFQSDLVAKITTFFSTTLPGYITKIATLWSTAWTTAASAFQTKIITPLGLFFTVTMNGYFTKTTALWTTAWEAMMLLFVAHVETPLQTYFTTTLPGVVTKAATAIAAALTTAFKNAETTITTDIEAGIKAASGNVTVTIKSGTTTAATPATTAAKPTSTTTPATSTTTPAAALPAKAAAAGGGITGSVPGAGEHDSVPAMLMPGEFVLRKSARMALESAYGPGYLNQMNQADTWLGSGSRGTQASQNRVQGGPPLMAAGGPTVNLELNTTALTTAIAAAQAAAAAAAANNAPGTAAAGSSLSNLVAVAKYLVAHGLSKDAAAGVAGDIDGESGGNPESVGTGGFGLIGWTGNTQGLPSGYTKPTGNATKDLDVQMAGVLGYIQANGGVAELNAASTSTTAAGDFFSQHFERPLVLDSDTRLTVANQVLAALAAGGAVQPFGSTKSRAWNQAVAGTWQAQKQLDTDFAALEKIGSTKSPVGMLSALSTLTGLQDKEVGLSNVLAGRSKAPATQTPGEYSALADALTSYHLTMEGNAAVRAPLRTTATNSTLFGQVMNDISGSGTSLLPALTTQASLWQQVWGPHGNLSHAPSTAPVASVSNYKAAVTWKWPAVQGATKYALWIYGAGGKVLWNKTVLGNSVTVSIPNVMSIKWQMRAGNTVGWGPASAMATYDFFYLSATANASGPNVYPHSSTWDTQILQALTDEQQLSSDYTSFLANYTSSTTAKDRAAFKTLSNEQSRQIDQWNTVATGSRNPPQQNQAQYSNLVNTLVNYRSLLNNPGAVRNNLRPLDSSGFDSLGTDIYSSATAMSAAINEGGVPVTTYGGVLPDIQGLETLWVQLYGPNGTLNPKNISYAPGNTRMTPTPAPVPGQLYPSAAGGAIGGGLNRLASGGTVSLNDLLSQVSVMPQMPSGRIGADAPLAAVSAAAAAPRGRSEAAQATVGGQGANVTFGDIIVQNPRPEAASTSITRATQKAAWLAGRQLS
jgi:phage-related protein